MKPKDTGEAYNKLTHLWERDGFDRNNGIEQHKRAIAFTKNRGKALDVGCGCSDRIINLLVSNGFSPEGIDISSEMLKIIKEKHSDIIFHHEDIVKWELTEKYDFISAWDSIWHVPLDQQEQVLQKLFYALNPGGICIFSCGALDEPGEHTNTAMGPEVYYSSLGTTSYFNSASNGHCACRHFEQDQFPETHAYFIVQKH